MTQPQNHIDEAPAYSATTAPQAAGPPPSPQEPARLGPMERLTGVLFSPGETYKDINRKPTWMVPTIIAMLVALAFTLFFGWYVNPDMDKFVRQQIRQRAEKSGSQMPSEEVIQQQVSITKTISKFAPVFAMVVQPVFYLLLAGIFALGMMLLQAQTTFKRILSVVAWTWASIGIVATVVYMASLMVQDRETLNNIDLNNPTANIPTNIGALLPSDMSPFVRSIATSIDVFTIWPLVLLSIGLAAIAGSKRIKPSSTGWMVFGLWAVWVLIKAGLASMFG